MNNGNKIISFTVSESCDNMNVNTYLKHHCKISARMITRLKREYMGITRNGTLLRTTDTVKAGDRVELKLPADNSEIVPVKGELLILFEDSYLVAVNKPPFMPVHPTKVHQLDTMANILMYHALQNNEHYTARILNRLDRDTSGVVVVAKDRFTAAALQKSIKKTYTAVCQGVIENSFTIDAPIKIMDGHTIQRCVSSDGERAVTHIKPIKNDGCHTLLDITLETGRTHQIRCHLSYKGYPLAGDDMYGGSLSLINRQALHCKTVELIHPITKEKITIDTTLPSDISNILNYFE
ncbi:MAG: RluA family pseudouridine synthase [Acutalibacteraceae bacterium]